MSVANVPHINYVTIENPASGLFETQVLDPMIHAVKVAPASITLSVFIYPWHLFSKRSCLLALRKTCLENQLRLRLYPVLFPVKYSLKNFFWLQLTLLWLALIARLMPKCDLAHCRGYFGAFIGLKSRSNCKVVFDMRSSWVDENVAVGRLTPNSNLHINWLKLERFCLRRSAYTIGVSDAMALVARRGPSQAYATIPIAANASSMGFSESFRNRMRNELGWERCHVAVYSGSFGLNQINLKVLSQLLGLLGGPQDDLRFLFLTREDPNLVVDLLRRAGVGEDRGKSFSVSPGMLGNYLSIADFGIHALPAQPDSETRLGTKVVEYWMNGLPTLVTSSVGAAAKIINKFGVGQVLQIESLQGSSEQKKVDISRMSRDNFRLSFKALDTKQFDVQGIVAKYMKVYEIVLRPAIGLAPREID